MYVWSLRLKVYTNTKLKKVQKVEDRWRQKVVVVKDQTAFRCIPIAIATTANTTEWNPAGQPPSINI